MLEYHHRIEHIEEGNILRSQNINNCSKPYMKEKQNQPGRNSYLSGMTRPYMKEILRLIHNMRMFIMLCSMIATVQGSAYITVTSQPELVQAQNAELIIGWALSKEVAAGGWIRLQFPEEMTVSASVTNCREIDGQMTFSSCTANIEKNYIEFVPAKAVTLLGTTSASYQVRASSAINLPDTIATVDPITVVTSGGEFRTTTFRATQGELTSVKLTPKDLTVGADTTLQLEIVTGHDIPKRGKLNVAISEAWNQGADGARTEYFSSISCAEFKNGATTITPGEYVCSFLDGPRVEIDGGFEAARVPAGTTITIEIVGFRNPIQANEEFEIFSVYTSGENEADIVDLKTGAVRVTDAAQLTNVLFDVSPVVTENIGIVQEQNDLSLRFATPVPLRANCWVSYWFPTAFYDADQITSIRTGALFSNSPRTMKAEGTPGAQYFYKVEEQEGGKYKSVTFQSCAEFRSQERPETSYIYGMYQPQTVSPTKTIKIYLRDEDLHGIANVESGVTYTPLQGSLSVLSTALSPTTVSDATAMITFSIQPDHLMRAGAPTKLAGGGPKLQIELPSDYVVQDACEVDASENDSWASARTCTPSALTNSLMIGFITTDDYDASKPISVKAGPVKLPPTIAGGKGEFRLTTFGIEQDTGLPWAVDAGAVSDLFTMTVGGFTSAVVTPSTLNAYVKAEYEFTLEPQHMIPQYGLIRISYPDQIDIEDASLTQTLCNSWEGFTSQTPVCTILPDNRTLIVSKGFQVKAQEAAVLKWKVPYITNPPTLVETGSFTVETMDQYFALIDYIALGVTVKMDKAAVFKSSDLELVSYTNTAKTMYRFTIVATSSVQAGNCFLITFPDTCTLPAYDGDLECNSVYVLYFGAISCKRYSGTLPDGTVVTNAVLGVVSMRKTVPPLETFSFDINNIMNPNSTRPSDPIKVQIFETVDMLSVINEDAGNLIVITSVPHTIAPEFTSFAPSVVGAGLPSTYTIEVSLEHSIKAGGGLLIRYPSQVGVIKDGLQVSVFAEDYQFYEVLDKATVDYSARQILYLQEGFDTAVTVTEERKDEKKLQITIEGLKNPLHNEKSSSFEVVTFNRFEDEDSSVLYFIDQVIEGLNIDSLCDYPCNDCEPTDPTSCLSCFPAPTSDRPYLQEDTCLAECSDGRYYDQATLRCELCDPTCLTCSGSKDICTSCGVGDYLHLRNTDCVVRCGPGYIEKPSENMCEPCKAGCSACSVSTDNCTACMYGGQTPYYFDFDCHEACPGELSIFKNDKCYGCQAKCKTCEGDVGKCTSCHDYMRFDPLNQDCLEACKPAVQIYQPDSGECATCHPDCITCVGDVTTCTSCKEDLVLNKDSVCRDECEGSSRQTAVDGKCRECESPCNTCDGEVDVCTTCQNDFILFKTTCVDHCPDRYEANNNTDLNQCILVGLICPEAFTVNAAGDGCVPREFECQPGYEINPKKTACIPAPGTPVPFPFLFTVMLIFLLVSGSQMKDKNTKPYTCLIMLVGSMEILQYFLIALFSGMLQHWFACLLATIAFLAQIVANVTFSLWFKQGTLKDQAFADWIRVYPKTKNLLQLAMLVLNFKCVRFVFSGFFGLDHCQAVFDDPNTSTHRNLRMLSLVQLVFVYAPIFVADVYIFFAVGWGHQLLVVAIETFILQLLMLYLTLEEFKDPEKMYLQSEMAEYQTLKPRKNGQIAVMGAFDDDGIDELNLVRLNQGDHEYEVQLRKKALTALLQQVSLNFKVSEQKGLDIGNEIPKVYTKFDSAQIRLRRAFSMEDLNSKKLIDNTDGTKLEESEDTDDIIDSDDSQYDVIRNRRYSYPLIKITNEEMADPVFANQVTRIRDAVMDELYKDNCYKSVKPREEVSKIHTRKKKMVNRRTQTYLRELLCIKNGDVKRKEAEGSDMEVVMEEEAEIDDQYTKGLIQGVIDHQSDPDSQDGVLTDPRARKGKKKRAKNVPDFEINDILGAFEIDDQGNYIILRGEQGELLDRNERLVNKRGYLIDKFGNVVSRTGQTIFKRDQLDSDDEIPAPYGFEKRKQDLLSGNEDRFKVDQWGNGPGRDFGQESLNDEDIVNEHLNQITASRFGEDIHLDSNGNIDDMIDIITKKKVPLKKDNMKNAQGKKKKNPPPKRFRPEDKLFIQGQDPATEQARKLNKIAQSIGGFAQQVASDATKSELEDNFQRGKSLRDSNYNMAGAGFEGSRIEPTRQNSAIASRKNPGNGTLDFYMSRATINNNNQDGNQSVLSQDLVFLNENIGLTKQGSSAKKGQKLFAGGESNMLKKVYGNMNDMSGFDQRQRLTDLSPAAHGASRIRPDSSGQRIMSGDPRLRGLENIYLAKFNKNVAGQSQKNINLKKPFQQGSQPKARKTYMANMDTDDFQNTQELQQMNNQRSAMVAETIDRLQQDYLLGGVAARAVNSNYQSQTQDELNLNQQMSATGSVGIDPSKRLLHDMSNN